MLDFPRSGHIYALPINVNHVYKHFLGDNVALVVN